MSLLLLLCAALPSSFAGTADPAGVAVVNGVVEVPLLAGPGGADARSYVEATVGDQKLLLRVATGHRKLVLSEGAVGRLGVKTSGKDAKKNANVDALALGSANFTNLEASVAAVDPSGAVPVDGEIGLPGFEGLAFAVVPSAGVLRLATGEAGAGLVGAIGTPATAASVWKDQTIKVGDVKQTLPGVALSANAKWSGVEVPTSLAIESAHTWLARELQGVDWYTIKKNAKAPIALPAAPAYQRGETAVEWRELGLAGATVPAHVDRPGKGPVALVTGTIMAEAGADVLGGLDLAFDPNAGTYAVRAGGPSKRGDAVAAYEARLRAALEAKPGKDGAAPDDEAKKAARAGGIGPLADFLEARGRYEEAVALRKEQAEADAGACTGWLTLGQTLSAAGRPAEAIEPLTKAASLYQPWAALPLAERDALSEDAAKAEKAGKEFTGQKAQDHACHVATGLAALAQVQSRNAAAVAALYPSQLDLDANLPLAAGSAALLQGKFEAAQAAYLQALKLRGGDNDDARVGLYLALAARDFPAARLQLERLRLRTDGATDPLLLRLYVEGVRASEGASGVTKALDALLAADPGDGLLLAQRSKERAAAGDAAGAASDWSAAEARFTALLAASPEDGVLRAAWASALAIAGQFNAARTVADAALKLAPTDERAWLAVADAAAAAGDATGAAEARARAGVLGASNPGYALLLAQ